MPLCQCLHKLIGVSSTTASPLPAAQWSAAVVKSSQKLGPHSRTACLICMLPFSASRLALKGVGVDAPMSMKP